MSMVINQTTDIAQHGHTSEELTSLISTFGFLRFNSPSDVRDPNYVRDAKRLLIEQFKYVHSREDTV